MRTMLEPNIDCVNLSFVTRIRGNPVPNLTQTKTRRALKT